MLVAHLLGHVHRAIESALAADFRQVLAGDLLGFVSVPPLAGNTYTITLSLGAPPSRVADDAAASRQLLHDETLGVLSAGLSLSFVTLWQAATPPSPQASDEIGSAVFDQEAEHVESVPEEDARMVYEGEQLS